MAPSQMKSSKSFSQKFENKISETIAKKLQKEEL